MKSKKPSTEKTKLMIPESPLREEQVRAILQRTDPRNIRTRPAPGGGTVEYVTGTYIKKALNFLFGYLWDFQIIDKGREGNEVWVQGRLTIRKPDGEVLMIKEQFGGAQIKFKRGTSEMIDYGNDLKSAATDSLKKCASEIGIASDVYGKNEFREVQVVKEVETPDTPEQIFNVEEAEEEHKKRFDTLGVNARKSLLK